MKNNILVLLLHPELHVQIKGKNLKSHPPLPHPPTHPFFLPREYPHFVSYPIFPMEFTARNYFIWQFPAFGDLLTILLFQCLREFTLYFIFQTLILVIFSFKKNR